MNQANAESRGVNSRAPKRVWGLLRRMLRRALLFALIALGGGFTLYRAKLAPVPVTAYRVTRGDIVAEVMGTGTLEAHIKAGISPKIQGRLVQVLVDQNDRVTSGQLLARLDDSELRQQVEVAQANLAAARATAERVRADEARARAVLKQAQLEHERVSALVSGTVASPSDRDKSIEKLRIAEADLARAQAATVEADRQQVVAEKQLGYQQELLANTRIPSPFDGLVVRRNRDPGDVVMPGGAILEVIATQEIWVSAWVDETAMADLAVGQAARVVFRSEPMKCYPGAVARLGRQTDRETREFLVDVLARELPRNWTIGQRAEVYIETARKTGVLMLPSKCVVWRGGKSGVLMNDDGRAVWREVTLGVRGRDEIEAAGGLEVDDEVVTPLAAEKLLAIEGRRISVQ